jgi:hypothetical protein
MYDSAYTGIHTMVFSMMRFVVGGITAFSYSLLSLGRWSRMLHLAG